MAFYFTELLRTAFQLNETLEIGHGRIEKRKATLLEVSELISEANSWPGLNCIVKIETERYIKSTQQTSKEIRYYITSCTNTTAEKMNQLIRQHWSIENKLHWQLNVNFGEDDARKRVGNAAKNFNLIMKTALALLKRDKTEKRSVRRKGMKASFDWKYREKIMMV